MNIGIYTPTYPGLSEGGIGTYTRHLAQGLTARGHEVHVLTPGRRDQEHDDGGVSVHTTLTSYLRLFDRIIPGTGYSWRVSGAMRRLARRYALDVVEFPNWEGPGLCFCAGRPTPLVVRLYTTSLDSQSIDGGSLDRRKRWDIRREAWQAKLADALVTHSVAHRAAIADSFKLPADEIALVPLGVPVYPAFERPVLNRDSQWVVYLGRLERRKGTIDLLRAVPAIVSDVPNVQFALIGADRPHCPGGRTHAQFAADELTAEVRQHLHFLGELPSSEVDDWLQSADLFVAPSLYESFGLIFPEAMRWGTPVVGTRTGGIPEIIEDGVTGALVSPGQPGELAAKIVSLLKSPDERSRLGNAGRRHVEANFSVERMAQRVSELYEHTLRAKR